MSLRRAAFAVFVSLAAMLELRADPAGPEGAVRLAPTGFSTLDRWEEDDHAAAFAAFRRTCAPVVGEEPVPRPAQAADESLRRACAAALTLAQADRHVAKSFFETHFEPALVVPASGQGFLTGYFEPEYPGALEATDRFTTPLLARPDDLVAAPRGESLPGLDPTLQAARRGDAGYEAYPDRGAIEDGALGERARPIVFVEPVEAFIVHVQGSARIRLPGGGVVRVAYAGRNGHPYASIGKILVQQGRIPLERMSLESLTTWLKEHPDEARAIMRQNRSYIFFRRADEIAPDDGPIGGAGAPLTPGRSLAVDRALWSYGLPVWLEGELPLPQGGTEALRRLMVAQDTGSAIVGPARGDFFFGSGPEAGARAGLLRHPVRFVVLRPKP